MSANNYIDFRDTKYIFAPDGTPMRDVWVGTQKVRTAGLPPEAVPTDLLTVQGYFFDPYYEDGLAQNSGGGASIPATIGDPVGYVQSVGWYPTTLAGTTVTFGSARAFADSNAERPTLVDVDGRRGFQFDGVDDALWRYCTGAQINAASTITYAAMIWTDGANTVGCPWEIRRGELGAENAMFRPILFDANNSPEITPKWTMFDTATIDEDDGYSNYANTSGWNLYWIELQGDDLLLDGETGQFYSEVEDFYRSSIPFTVDVGIEDAYSYNRHTMGHSFFGVNKSKFFNGVIGRYYWGFDRFSTSDKERIKRWLRGTTFVDGS